VHTEYKLLLKYKPSKQQNLLSLVAVCLLVTTKTPACLRQGYNISKCHALNKIAT